MKRIVSLCTAVLVCSAAALAQGNGHEDKQGGDHSRQDNQPRAEQRHNGPQNGPAHNAAPNAAPNNRHSDGPGAGPQQRGQAAGPQHGGQGAGPQQRGQAAGPQHGGQGAFGPQQRGAAGRPEGGRGPQHFEGGHGGPGPRPFQPPMHGPEGGHWAGFGPGHHEPHYHVMHPWAHGHFPRPIGPSHFWRLAGGGPDYFWFGGYHFGVVMEDRPFCAGWDWNGDEIVLYPDPHNVGLYLAFNTRLGTYIHVEFLR